MKLEAVATLGTKLWQLRLRADLGSTAATGLLEAFEADGAIVWLGDTGGPCEAEDLYLAGALVQPGAKAEIAVAIRAGRLEHWIATHGGALYNGAEVGGDEESCGMVAVAWRNARRMPSHVDAFLAFIGEQVKAVLEREAVLAEFETPKKEGDNPDAAVAPRSLRVVSRGGGMGVLLEQAPDAVVLHTLRGKIIDANVAACDALGYTRRELIGMNLGSLMAPGAARAPWLRPNFAKAKCVHTDYVLRRKEGGPVKLLASTRVVRANGEEFAVMFGREPLAHGPRSTSGRDRVVMATSAVPSASPMHSVLDSIADHVFVRDMQGCYVQANPAFAAALGRSVDDILGRRDAELLPPDVASALTFAHVQVLNTGQIMGQEIALPVGGEPHRFLARSAPWCDEQRRVVGVVTIATDVTELHETAAQHDRVLQDLTSANERTERLLSDQRRLTDRTASLLGIARTLGTGLDAEHARAVALAAVEQHIPQASCAIGGYDPISHEVRIAAYGRGAELLKFDADRFRADDASFGDDLLRGCTYSRMRLGPSDFAVDTLLRTRGARGLAAVPLLMGGRPGGVMLLAWPQDREPRLDDVTLVEHVAAHLAQALDNARLYAELRETVTSLRAAQDQVVRTQRLRALGEMAAGVAHDFNNSLTTILGLSEWMLHSLPEAHEVRGDIGTIRNAATDAAAICRRLQMFGRSAPTTTSAETLNLAELAAQVVDMAHPQVQEREKRDGVTFHLTVEASPAPLVHAVEGEIRELLLNLLLNAIDAMPRGGRIAIRTRQARGGAQVAVVDEGVGMTEDVKRRVFEPFFTTKGRAGNGLGLSVCWGIAERHGGTLAVDSTPGAGSTFTLTLPAAIARQVVERPAPVARSAAVAVGSLRILLVDDQADVRESVADMLGALGHEVTQADRGSLALERLAQETCDLLITDLGMDGMDGLELAQLARARQPALPIILLTGWGADYESQVPPNITLVVAKPVTMRALREAVAQAAQPAEPAQRIS